MMFLPCELNKTEIRFIDVQLCKAWMKLNSIYKVVKHEL